MKTKSRLLKSFLVYGELWLSLTIMIGLVSYFFFLISGKAKIDEDLGIFYSVLIDDVINKCQHKANLQKNQSSETKMNQGTGSSPKQNHSLSFLKSRFFEHHRESLIQAMIENNIGKMPSRIYSFLDKRFYDDFRKRDIENVDFARSH